VSGVRFFPVILIFVSFLLTDLAFLLLLPTFLIHVYASTARTHTHTQYSKANGRLKGKLPASASAPPLFRSSRLVPSLFILFILIRGRDWGFVVFNDSPFLESQRPSKNGGESEVPPSPVASPQHQSESYA